MVVFGSDETVEFFRKRVRADQRFLAHAHRISFGVVFDDPDFQSVAGAARSVSLYDQQGCLSPHLFYVDPKIAVALRKEFAFRAAVNHSEPPASWGSDGSTAWTVLYDPEPQFTASCLNRVVYVKPLPEDLPAAVRRVYKHLSTIGIYPATPANAEKVVLTGASRICPIGQMQFPPITWHHDAQPVLLPLVHWVDFEEA